MGQAVKNEWVLKNKFGQYAENICGGKVMWTDNLADARLYSRKNYAVGSLDNYYYNAGRPLLDDGSIYPVKLRVVLQEVYE